jgi:predicted enzyme related to lactoylglutathione lyase
MKSEFLGLRTAIYKVPDIKKAKAWYSKVLGIKPYFDEPFYVGFNVGGYELGLNPDRKSETSKIEGVTTYWGVDDVRGMYQTLLDHGATAHEEPNDVGGEIIVAAVKDPWGNVFGIIYNPHFILPK